MLQQLVAQLRLPDVHFIGHVTNEELTAFYDVADLFLCASEHEGFCVPLDRGVPQARAGAGLRGHGGARDAWTAAACSTTTKDPVHVARAHRRDRRRDADLQDRILAGAGRRARSAAGAATSTARCSASSSGRCDAAAPAHPAWRSTSGISSRRAETLEELREYRPGRSTRRCPTAARPVTGPAR